MVSTRGEYQQTRVRSRRAGRRCQTERVGNSGLHRSDTDSSSRLGWHSITCPSVRISANRRHVRIGADCALDFVGDAGDSGRYKPLI